MRGRFVLVASAIIIASAAVALTQQQAQTPWPPPGVEQPPPPPGTDPLKSIGRPASGQVIRRVASASPGWSWSRCP